MFTNKNKSYLKICIHEFSHNLIKYQTKISDFYSLSVLLYIKETKLVSLSTPRDQ